jgi:hypothetical protein
LAKVGHGGRGRKAGQLGVGIGQGVVRRARLLYAAGVFRGVFGGGALRSVGGGVRKALEAEREADEGLGGGEGAGGAGGDGGKDVEFGRIAAYLTAGGVGGAGDGEGLGPLGGVEGPGVDDGDWGVGADVEVTGAMVRQWYEKSEPDGVSWDEWRERWDGGLVRMGFDDSGEVDVRLRVLGQCEVIMATAMSALRNVELFGKGGERVEVLYTAGGKAVSVGGLQPQSFEAAMRASLQAGKLAVEQAEALREVRDEAQEREVRLMELSMYVLERLELTDAQKGKLGLLLEEEGLMLPGGDEGEEGYDEGEVLEGEFGEGDG